jgi:heptosyltransferase-2
MALPALGAVRAAFPHSHIAVAAAASVAPLFEERTPAAQDELITIERDTGLLSGGSAPFDAALLLPNSFRAAWAARRGRIPERWGYAGNLRSWLLTRAVPRPSGRRHQSLYYAELVRGLGIEGPDALPRVSVRAETAQRAQTLLSRHGVSALSPIVGFAPGAAYGHAKRWPPRRVADVIARLSAERGATCVLVGAAGDRDAGREIESSLPAGVQVVDLIGRTDLRLLAGVLARCDAFVSNDSGAMHLAAAIGVPVAAIFGPTDDRVTAPLGDHDVLVHDVFCRPCMLRDCPIDHRCMKGITADAVVRTVATRLERKRGAVPDWR